MRLIQTLATVYILYIPVLSIYTATILKKLGDLNSNRFPSKRNINEQFVVQQFKHSP